ncbi:unnamed protein product [Cuscuta epithymum]|uniref:Myb-like domain-containing protein n=1 Tax=Cuscuta epithymum TaxID=186058 RepID=A0AAV0DA64_9ASTE|nr:unnamed protein product [Cuscuta epithymum]
MDPGCDQLPNSLHPTFVNLPNQTPNQFPSSDQLPSSQRPPYVNHPNHTPNQFPGSDQLPSSQRPPYVNLPSQTPNQFTTSISPQFHPSYQFNTMNGSCPPYTNLHYGPPFPIQNVLNTPVFPSGATETHTTRGGGGRKKPKDVHNNSNETSVMWSSEEDIALTQAWLRISTDPGVGNNQKHTAMWERILQVWKDNIGDHCKKPRNSNSLQCRWQKIQKSINKFHGIYEKLERHPQSGSNPEDIEIILQNL